ncbi:MAG: 3-dehydroquinate synthase [Victivallales bacterium]|nr:3-dehydroquinate synthase [Victivallales bacterium]
MRTLFIKTTPEYEVNIGSGWPAGLSKALAGHTEAIVVSDSRVAPLYLAEAEGICRAADLPTGHYVFPAGESAKHLGTIQAMLAYFAEFGLTRSGVVLALGGGVTGDMAGFASAIWLRGVPFIQLPTTLLAMVDSSIGGKTGVDLAGCGKNLVGAFHQPKAVFANIDTLETLDEKYRLDGLAEVLKTCMLRDAPLFRSIVADVRLGYAEETIARCAGVKAEIVERDPTERGERKLLNLGHTAGHAIELASGFRVSHGLAVAMGMAMVARAGAARGITSRQARNAILEGLSAAGLPTVSPFPVRELVSAMRGDKKRSGGNISLVVPEELGQCRILSLPLDGLQEFYEADND